MSFLPVSRLKKEKRPSNEMSTERVRKHHIVNKLYTAYRVIMSSVEDNRLWREKNQGLQMDIQVTVFATGTVHVNGIPVPYEGNLSKRPRIVFQDLGGNE